jgi:hypothetical protein
MYWSGVILLLPCTAILAAITAGKGRPLRSESLLGRVDSSQEILTKSFNFPSLTALQSRGAAVNFVATFRQIFAIAKTS